MFSPGTIRIAILTATGALLVIAAWKLVLLWPHVVQTDVDNFYPPISLLLFVPFVRLTRQLWWSMPGVIVGAAVWWHRRQTRVASSSAPEPKV